MFGGGLPVLHRTVTASAKGMGDRSHKPCGQMEHHIHWIFMNVRKQATRKKSAVDGAIWAFVKKWLKIAESSAFDQGVFLTIE
ncbi:hypothetical protein D3C76_300040 [compost metagenome]|nr:hypothetical protein J53TS2_36060 [Paenibacillus sp. J53TS2]